MNRDTAIAITAALTIIPNSTLSLESDSTGRSQWFIRYGDKDNRHSYYCAPTLEELTHSLTAGEWGGWKA